MWRSFLNVILGLKCDASTLLQRGVTTKGSIFCIYAQNGVAVHEVRSDAEMLT